MKRYLWYFLFTAAWLGACRKEKPPNVMSKEEMTNFLIEVYLAEARISAIPVSRDSALKLFYPKQKNILHERGVTDSTLRVTYQYYLQHPDEMEAILGSVIDSLTLREQKLFNPQE